MSATSTDFVSSDDGGPSSLISGRNLPGNKRRREVVEAPYESPASITKDLLEFLGLCGEVQEDQEEPPPEQMQASPQQKATLPETQLPEFTSQLGPDTPREIPIQPINIGIAPAHILQSPPQPHPETGLPPPAPKASIAIHLGKSGWPLIEQRLLQVRDEITAQMNAVSAQRKKQKAEQSFAFPKARMSKIVNAALKYKPAKVSASPEFLTMLIGITEMVKHQWHVQTTAMIPLKGEKKVLQSEHLRAAVHHVQELDFLTEIMEPQLTPSNLTQIPIEWSKPHNPNVPSESGFRYVVDRDL